MSESNSSTAFIFFICINARVERSGVYFFAQEEVTRDGSKQAEEAIQAPAL